MVKKMGRPTDSPKNYRVNARINENQKNILDTYCEQQKVTQMEGVRKGIEKLQDDIKK